MTAYFKSRTKATLPLHSSILNDQELIPLIFAISITFVMEFLQNNWIVKNM